MSSKAPAAASAASTADASLVSLQSALFKGVSVDVEASLGSVALTVEHVLGMKNGEVLTLDKRLNEQVELTLNGQVIARGELVAVDDHFGVRLTEVARPE
ncbi:FliM/FliN family flagellar motor switch protein [Brevundimonas faecalis]|uniref:Flagellar motor switch protein FliN n=1 Tax=Brevundimonas faecalis TaxID=947378 RepID=A0ABV2R7K9_9CAUL